MKLDKEHWNILKQFFPKKKRKIGRPPLDNKSVLEGILWVLKSGARWKDLPSEYPPYQTCHRRFQTWTENKIINKILKKLSSKLYMQGKIDLDEAFIDGSFAPAKKGGDKVGKTKKGKGTKIMGIMDSNGLPIGCSVECASPHEIKFVRSAIDNIFAPYLPTRLIGDKAYDSDQLDVELKNDLHINLIAPHKINRKSPSTQDGRSLRRYKKRWKVERGFSWLQNYRRLVTRYEVKSQNFAMMVLLGCMMILLRNIV